MIRFIVTNAGTINAVVNSKAFVVPRDHVNYDKIKEAINKNDGEMFVKLVDIPKAVNNFTEGNVKVEDGVVYWKDKPIHNVITDKILMLMREGFPFKPVLLFYENLMANPSYRATQELYPFLDRQGLPITEDGCFLGYKRVQDNFTDQYSGVYLNTVGTVHEVERNTVDDNWREACSSGFHVGSIEYVRDFHKNTGHVMIVKVNPKDVVSVPTSENTKLRTCKYEVVGEHDRALVDALPDTLHSPNGTVSQTSGMGGYGYQDTPTTPVYDSSRYNEDDEDEDEDDWDDEDEDDSDLDDEDEDDDDEDTLNRGWASTIG